MKRKNDKSVVYLFVACIAIPAAANAPEVQSRGPKGPKGTSEPNLFP